MHNVLKYSKHYKTVAVRLRLIFQFTYVQYSIQYTPIRIIVFKYLPTSANASLRITLLLHVSCARSQIAHANNIQYWQKKISLNWHQFGYIPVPLRFRSGSYKLKFCRFYHICDSKENCTYFGAWWDAQWVTRRLTRLKSMCNVLKVEEKANDIETTLLL